MPVVPWDFFPSHCVVWIARGAVHGKGTVHIFVDNSLQQQSTTVLASITRERSKQYITLRFLRQQLENGTRFSPVSVKKVKRISGLYYSTNCRLPEFSTSLCIFNREAKFLVQIRKISGDLESLLLKETDPLRKPQRLSGAAFGQS